MNGACDCDVAEVSENAAMPLPTGGGGAGVDGGGGGAGGAGGGGVGADGGGVGAAGGGGLGVVGGGVGPAPGGGGEDGGVDAAVSLPPQPASTVLAAAVNSKRRRLRSMLVKPLIGLRGLLMSDSAWGRRRAADYAEQRDGATDY
jgi:hypothetical protein